MSLNKTIIVCLFGEKVNGIFSCLSLMNLLPLGLSILDNNQKHGLQLWLQHLQAQIKDFPGGGEFFGQFIDLN